MICTSRNSLPSSITNGQSSFGTPPSVRSALLRQYLLEIATEYDQLADGAKQDELPG
jgi:hypothetical protein